MTIGIAGPKQNAPQRHAVAGFLIAAIIVGTGMILLGFLGNFLVDWMWFSSIGYPQVFRKTIGAKVGIFLVVFATTAVALWANAHLALKLARRRGGSAGFGPKGAAAVAPPDPLGFMRERLPWPRVTAAVAGLLALLVAWGETDNWSTLLQFLFQVPYGTR